MRDYGGIYLDLDVIVFKPFDDLLYNDFTMGIQKDVGLCNAVIISRPFAPFVTRWIQQYKNFNDSDWDYHSVKLPWFMAKEYPDYINILDEKAFFWPTWSVEDLELMYKSNNYTFTNHQYTYHMWAAALGRKNTSDLFPTSIKNVENMETSFNRAVRKFLKYLPDDFNETNFNE
ncbi:20119_t:CDS:1 [Racocetra fulgida]|uniref:20119_t:CDS:1 n=1 Tax=Racocetra fulgida TaxID=60492 RepID=A0A9N9C3N8_9GLOM|nr:20119_t:CDS:1 [Racocetra fulgida]